MNDQIGVVSHNLARRIDNPCTSRCAAVDDHTYQKLAGRAGADAEGAFVIEFGALDSLSVVI